MQVKTWNLSKTEVTHQQKKTYLHLMTEQPIFMLNLMGALRIAVSFSASMT